MSGQKFLSSIKNAKYDLARTTNIIYNALSELNLQVSNAGNCKQNSGGFYDFVAP